MDTQSTTITGGANLPFAQRFPKLAAAGLISVAAPQAGPDLSGPPPMPIRKGKPIPRKTGGKDPRWQNLADRLEVGDCVEGLTDSESACLRTAMYRNGWRSTRRKEGDKITMWRIS